jgi:hypothetical protein
MFKTGELGRTKCKLDFRVTRSFVGQGITRDHA